MSLHRMQAPAFRTWSAFFLFSVEYRFRRFVPLFSDSVPTNSERHSSNFAFSGCIEKALKASWAGAKNCSNGVVVETKSG
jgi:hypothetical protein